MSVEYYYLTHKKKPSLIFECFAFQRTDCGFKCVARCNLTNCRIQEMLKDHFSYPHNKQENTSFTAPYSRKQTSQHQPVECTEPITPQGLWWNLIKKFVGKLILTKHKGHADATVAVNWTWQWGQVHSSALCVKLCSCRAGQSVSL